MRRTVLALFSVISCAVATSAAFADGVPPSQAKPDQKASAQAHFDKALERSKAGDHETAVTELRASYDVVASPNARLVLVRELVLLKRFAEAYREAEATEKVAEQAAKIDAKYQEAQRSARDERNELRAKVGMLRIDLGTKTGELTVQGRAISPDERGGPIAVDPGTVVVTLKGEGGQTSEKTIAVEAGADSTVTFEDAPAPKPKTDEAQKPSVHPFDMGEGQRITGFVFAGVGVVGMAMFAGFGAANQSIFSDLEDRCPGGVCSADAQADADRGKTFQTVANVSVVFGAIGLAAGAAFLIPTFFAKKHDEKNAEILPILGPGYVGVTGAF